MSEDFQALSETVRVAVENIFVPEDIGVGTLRRQTADGPAVLALRLVGSYLDHPELGPKTFMVALDTERAVGLIEQLKAFLLDSGVDPGQIIVMMKEAEARLKALDSEAPHDHYLCPDCGMVSHNPNDVANKYCGHCHEFKDQP